MAQDTRILNTVGQVQDPFAGRAADQSQPAWSAGRGSEVLTSEIRGKYATANDRGHLFSANRTAVTVPVIAATLVSVFGLYNPVGSGVDLELVDFDYGLVLATTVVDTIGLYYSASNNAATATFTTPGVLGTNVFSGRVGQNVAPRGQFYSAVTHVGTPIRHSILGTFGAVTTTSDVPNHLEFDGKVIIPEGTLVSVAMSTAASTASGVDLGLRWIEVLNK